MSDIQVTPSTYYDPLEYALVVIQGSPVIVRWDEIPDLITKLRRAYNSRLTEEQEK